MVQQGSVSYLFPYSFDAFPDALKLQQIKTSNFMKNYLMWARIWILPAVKEAYFVLGLQIGFSSKYSETQFDKLFVVEGLQKTLKRKSDEIVN